MRKRGKISAEDDVWLGLSPYSPQIIMMKRIVQSRYVKYKFFWRIMHAALFFLDVSFYGETLHTGIKSGIYRARYADPYKYYYKQILSFENPQI